MWYLQFCSFSRLLWLFRIFLLFHTNFWIIHSSSVKNVMAMLIGTVLNLEAALGSISILTILIHPVHDDHISFHFSVIILLSISLFLLILTLFICLYIGCINVYECYTLLLDWLLHPFAMPFMDFLKSLF